MSQVSQPTNPVQAKLSTIDAFDSAPSKVSPDTQVSSSAESSNATDNTQTKDSSVSPLDSTSPESITKDSRNPPHLNVKTTTHITSNGSTTIRSNIAIPTCKNCKTSTTPLWRRDESGQVLCNACGLFLKLHGRPRPISLKTDVIKSRNRVKNSQNKDSDPKNKDKKTSPKPKDKPNTSTNGNSIKQGTTPQSSSSTAVTSPTLVPLLPRNSNGIANTTSGKVTPKFPQLHHLPLHLQQQVPLHHPSSVPTQFHTNLSTITSPLLLSTIPKNSHDSPLAQAQLAAGALENLSHLPSKLVEIKKEELKLENSIKLKPFSPASALSGSEIVTSTTNGINGINKLPSLLNTGTPTPTNTSSSTGVTPNFYSSPSFGPQHSLTNPSAFSLLSSAMNSSNDLKNNTPNNSNSNHNTELIRLKNRISELELVNDLYKSRIHELENLEQQAQKRELELKRKYEALVNNEDEYMEKKLKLGTEVAQ